MKTIPNKGKVPNEGFFVACGAFKIVYEDEKYLVVKRANANGWVWYTKHKWSTFFGWGWWSNFECWSESKDGIMKKINLENNPLDLEKLLEED